MAKLKSTLSMTILKSVNFDSSMSIEWKLTLVQLSTTVDGV